MIKFLPLDILGVSHKILWKNESAVYHLQISALVPEIFKFEKCVEYTNEMTDDGIHSTQYYIRYIKHNDMAVWRRIVPRLWNIMFQWKLTLFQSPPTWFQYISDFQLENVKQGHKLKLTYLYACWIMYMGHHLQIWKWNTKGGQRCLLYWGGMEPIMLPW